ncbi:MAG: hypothetical protein QF723_06920, partial [Phycisphaerales bacterium]|nr:hypothetical protein [Phycisphaerales bacterium]
MSMFTVSLATLLAAADPGGSVDQAKGGADTELVTILTMLGIVVGAAIVAHVVVGWLLGRLARLSRGRLRWGGVVADAARMPAGLAIWLIAFTFVLEYGVALREYCFQCDDNVATDIDH